MSTTTTPFAAAQHYHPAETVEIRTVQLPIRFGEYADEYRQLRSAAGLCDRSDRGLIKVTGGDRKPWLHNLITNVVKTLEPGDGVYAFAPDVKGRTQFDLNVLARPDHLLLDIDRATGAAALAHLDMRLITEDVQLTDLSADCARLAVVGPEAARVAEVLGVTNFTAFADVQNIEVGVEQVLFRQDYGEVPGFELIVPNAAAAGAWDQLAGLEGVTPVGHAALDTLRVEAGVPWFGIDIDAEVIPPETGQVERGISYHKGCYLGQEVIERMRSRGVVAKRLVRVRGGEGPIETPAELKVDGKTVGRLTSYRQHPLNDAWVGLAYARSSVQAGDAVTAGEAETKIEVVGDCR
jgi:folate-binding protein YgfZ